MTRAHRPGVLARILWLVNGAFVAALLINLVILLQQGREDVVREQQGIKPLLQLLIESGQPHQILALVGSRLRHLSVQPVGQQSGNPSGLPDWFVDWFDSPDSRYRFAFTASDGESLVLVADVTGEITEIWEAAWHLVVVFVLAGVITNLAIWFGVRAGVQPLQEILQTLARLGQGRYQTRLGHYKVAELDRLAEHINQLAAELQKAEQDKQFLTRSLMTVQEQERAALARELHDDLGQHITGMRTQAYLIPYQQGSQESLQHISEQLLSSCDAVQTGFRRIIHDLYPVLLEQLGLAAALDEMIGHFQQLSGLECSFYPPSQWPPLSERDAAQIYRLVQEALNNVARHAEAKRVDVHIEAVGAGREGNGRANHGTTNSADGPSGAVSGLLIRIEDNGKGLAADYQEGIGLRSMAQRCLMLGGELQLHSSPSGGLAVCANLPCIAQQPDAAANRETQ